MERWRVQGTDSQATQSGDDAPRRDSRSRIVVSYKGKRIAKYRLAKRKVMIGRRHDCDIRINSRAASRHHAQIFSVLDDDYVLDLDSKNGTFVNARRIKKHALKDGDIISIGGFDLTYTRDTEPPADPA